MKESLSRYIDSFLTMIAVEKGLAKNTVEAYSRDLVRLSEFLIAQSVGSWEETETLHLRSYLSALRRQGLSPRSIARHIVTVRRFYGFLETEGVINENPVPRFHQVAGGRKLPQTLSADDVRKLLAQPDLQEPLGVRDQAMLELLYATGLRVSELITLQMQQINFQGNF
jgi:integrase/recombinase XerD